MTPRPCASTSDANGRPAGCAPRPISSWIRSLTLGLAATACEGDSGPPGPPGPPGGDDEPTPTVYAPGEAAPELRAAITELLGASGPAGEFLVGDTLTVRFTLTKEDGSAWQLSELVSGEALVSGPTFNYQRVLPMTDDVLSRAVDEGGGSFRYTFATALPAVYAAPYNDSPAFDQTQGELKGRALLAGTYTAGLSVAWSYTVEGREFLRVGETARDFLLGTGSGALQARAATTLDHCNRCHDELQAHDSRYRELVLCLACHTSGAEDANDPMLAGGTPGLTIDSRVLFHRIHNARQLPSVNGVATRVNGNRNYGVPPRPYLVARSDGLVRDFSSVGFPGMPNRVQPMPRDTGYDTLAPSQQAQEDVIRSGVSECGICHGDPDGDGPLQAPERGSLVYRQQSRRACGSCHDDVDFTRQYRSNGQVMGPQPDDSGCQSCHEVQFPGSLNPITAHIHPLHRANVTPGLLLELSAAVESGANDGDGTIDPGEKLAVTFTLRDGAGLDVDPATLESLRARVSGPTGNLQLVHDQELPLALLSGPQPFSLELTRRIGLEHVGDSTAALDTFQTLFAPHHSAPGVATRLFVRTGTAGGASMLAMGTSAHASAVELLDSTGFARGDVVVVGDGAGASEEYLRVQLVDGDRLWLSSSDPPARTEGLRVAHPAGALVREVQLTELFEDFDFSVATATGEIGELAEFGPGNAVLVSYTSDFVFPSEYPAPLDDSADLGDSTGEWTGKDIVHGTYLVGLTASQDALFDGPGIDTTYRLSSPAATRELLVGSAFQLEPYDRIQGESCEACHQELSYHDSGERGFEACILCHGVPGTEDRPRSIAGNAPETAGVSVDFRALLHRIHRGREQPDPDFLVVGEGPAPYPDNFRTRSYAGFSPLPAMPGRALECAKCHGPGNDEALLPDDRSHPTQQEDPVQVWRAACSGCHASSSTQAHIDSQTAPSGAEACEICHAEGEVEDAGLAHDAARGGPR